MSDVERSSAFGLEVTENLMNGERPPAAQPMQ
jgi:hypothetical protein